KIGLDSQTLTLYVADRRMPKPVTWVASDFHSSSFCCRDGVESIDPVLNGTDLSGHSRLRGNDENTGFGAKSVPLSPVLIVAQLKVIVRESIPQRRLSNL